jgi:two-component system, cell cycle response regulator DivK
MPASALGSDIPVRSERLDARINGLSTYVPPRADPDAPAVVLIAEDHEDSRDALSTLLDALGYRVLVAGNGAEAVDVALSARPDLILMDMMMPAMDGFQATRTLRADPAFRQVPIIAITAMEGAREAVFDAGCSDVVVKPIDIRVFLARLQGWLAPATGSA